MNKRIIASLALLGSMLTINAYTVEWAIPPQESTLSFWRDGLYLISNEDQQGLVNVHGHLLCSGDEIHYVGDGIHIIVEQTNMGYVIKGLLNREHEFVPVPGGLYKRGLYFTDGDIIAVQDASSRVGYLDLQGHVVVNCQFADGAPFREGWALVKTKDYKLMYISTDWDRTHKALKVDGGDLLDGKSFRGGATYVRNKKGWYKIGLDGKKINMPRAVQQNLESDATHYGERPIRNIECQEHPEKVITRAVPQRGDINIYTAADNLIGYTCQGKWVVPVQFWNDNPEDFDGDYVVVKQRIDDDYVLHGLLHKIDGDFTTLSADTLLRRGTSDIFTARVSYPPTLDASKLRVMVTNAAGTPVNATTQQFTGGVCQFTYRPTPDDLAIADGDWEITYQIYADYDLLLWEDTRVVSLVEPRKATIGSFQQQAAAGGRQTIWVNVNNPATASPVQATFTISDNSRTLGSTTQTIAAGSNARLQVSVDATRPCSATATVTLSSGPSRSTTLTITPPKPTEKPKPKPRVTTQTKEQKPKTILLKR
ncbi:MAG: WG repeat-containing protein [Muribaculaceae bacterium]|nr:WG repeat-containing protein [Muribaculaceae bacterium]